MAYGPLMSPLLVMPRFPVAREPNCQLTPAAHCLVWPMESAKRVQSSARVQHSDGMALTWAPTASPYEGAYTSQDASQDDDGIKRSLGESASDVIRPRRLCRVPGIMAWRSGWLHTHCTYRHYISENHTAKPNPPPPFHPHQDRTTVKYNFDWGSWFRPSSFLPIDTS